LSLFGLKREFVLVSFRHKELGPRDFGDKSLSQQFLAGKFCHKIAWPEALLHLFGD